MPTPNGRYLGRVKDPDDPRDHTFTSLQKATPFDGQSYVDLRPMLPPAYDQGQLNSCGANAADGLLAYWYPEVDGFSRLQIYYLVRALENNLGSDAGVMLRDVMKVLKDPGAVLEGLWPYIPNKVLAAPPNFPVSDRAYKITNYARLRTTDEMLNSLNAGLPFILGFDVYDSFDGEQIARTGIMTYPAADEAYLGGHAVLVVGYDTEFAYNADLKRSGVSHVDTGPAALLIRNSWGKDWGLDGHFWMPLDYPDDSSDVWAATVQEPIT